MTGKVFRYCIPILAVGLSLTAGWATLTTADAAVHTYRFTLVGKPTVSAGKDTVQVRLVDAADGKPVLNAVILASKAYMGPQNTPTMTAPVKALPAKDGVYSFEVDLSMAGAWALHLAAKVPDEPNTVLGTINIDVAN